MYALTPLLPYYPPCYLLPIRQVAALERIPILLQLSPADSAELCSPLVIELLSLNNQYNIDNFNVLQSTALLSLLLKHVNITGRYVCMYVCMNQGGAGRLFLYVLLTKFGF